MAKRILDMVKKRPENELKKVNIYVDFDCYYKTKKYFSIAILQYNDIFKTIYFLYPEDTPRASMTKMMEQSLRELKKDCVVNIYPRKSFGLKCINSRYESGVAPLKISHSSAVISLINVMRTSGHIVNLHLDDKLFVEKIKELNLDVKFNEAKNIVKMNKKLGNNSFLSLINPQCVNEIFNFYLKHYNNGSYDKERLISISSGGQDKLSRMKLNELKRFVSNQDYEIISKKFNSERNREQVIRWVCRGLTLDLAMNKVLLRQKRFFSSK